MMLPEFQIDGVALMTEAALRLWLIVSGVVVAGHYHAMANSITKAPSWLRALALPVITSSGVGMAFCGLIGDISYAALFAILAAGVMPMVQLAAWGAGAYVSDQLARAERMKQHRNEFMSRAIGGAEQLSDMLDEESSPAPLTKEAKKVAQK